jgi:carbonic anhydrase
MFIVRNAGNLIPHSKFFVAENTTTEPAALELGCVINKIQHVVVCGHSECPVSQKQSPLTGWLCNHGLSSLDKLQILQEHGFDKPLLFEGETPMRKFVAYIDPENKFILIVIHLFFR